MLLEMIEFRSAKATAAASKQHPDGFRLFVIVAVAVIQCR